MSRLVVGRFSTEVYLSTLGCCSSGRNWSKFGKHIIIETKLYPQLKV